jgi:hypothetical protein
VCIWRFCRWTIKNEKVNKTSIYKQGLQRKLTIKLNKINADEKRLQEEVKQKEKEYREILYLFSRIY